MANTPINRLRQWLESLGEDEDAPNQTAGAEAPSTEENKEGALLIGQALSVIGPIAALAVLNLLGPAAVMAALYIIAAAIGFFLGAWIARRATRIDR